MPIVITMKKAAIGAPQNTLKNSLPPPNPLPPEIAQLVDEVGALQDEATATAKRIKGLQAQLKPYADKMKVLAELATKYAVEEAIDPDQVFTEVTDNFLMQVGKAGTLRTVANIELVLKVLGKKLFFEKCTIGLGVLDNYLTPEQKQQVLKVERCTRGVTVMQRIKVSHEK
jgi:hypothetical protein